MKTSIKRALLLVLLGLHTAAQAAQPVGAVPNPITETTPLSKTDETKVYAFFKFNCPVCRNYHIGLEYWGKSLPKPMTFQFVPVLEGGGGHAIGDESAKAAMMFWAVERAGNRAQRATFADAAYALTQDSHEQGNVAAWMDAVASSSIDQARFVSAWKAEQQMWPYRADLQVHYEPSRTPTLVICGKWVISPDSTNGNQELFFQLANGLVSKCLGPMASK